MVAAGRAAINAFSEQATVPREELGWDTYPVRLSRYYDSDLRYNNKTYASIFAYGAVLKHQKGLYKYTRGIYNPVQRLVDMYPAKCYGGSIDLEYLRKGALPIAQADDTLREALRQLVVASNLGTQKSVYVRNGAKFGDSVIKVVDDRERGQVRLEMLMPGIVKHAEFDQVGNVKAVTLEYYRYEEKQYSPTNPMMQVKQYCYTEYIDGDKFQTFRDGKPYAFYMDARGNAVAEWPNEYGFVPMVIVQHKDVGLAFGANAYHASLDKIDELNDAASLLSDQVRKAVNLVWYYAGVARREDLDISVDEKDGIPAVYGPKDSQPHAMVAQLDIAAASQEVQYKLAEIERDLPELSLYHIREGGNLTAPGVEAGYQDAVEKIVEARGNYDDGLVRALQMGVSIGGYNRYDGFLAFSLDSYRLGNLEFSIADRSVIKDQISKKERIELLKQSNAPDSAIWKELDVADDTIAEWEQERLMKAQLALMAAQQSQLPSGQEPPAEPVQITSGGEYAQEAQ
jgi:hypothetical protein